MYDANRKVAQEIENLKKTLEVINTAVVFGNLPENTRAHLTSAHNAIVIAIRHMRGQRVTIDKEHVRCLSFGE
jgi:hypothetical protein